MRKEQVFLGRGKKILRVIKNKVFRKIFVYKSDNCGDLFKTQ
jgi:hypothetical protein